MPMRKPASCHRWACVCDGGHAISHTHISVQLSITLQPLNIHLAGLHSGDRAAAAAPSPPAPAEPQLAVLCSAAALTRCVYITHVIKLFAATASATESASLMPATATAFYRI